MPLLARHLSSDDLFTMEAAFTSHVVTLFRGVSSAKHQTTLIELFLLHGETVLVELLCSMLATSQHKIIDLQEENLISYLQKDMVDEVLSKNSDEICRLLPSKFPRDR